MNISGKTEFDIFKNYYTPEKMKSCRLEVHKMSLQSKNNVTSEHLRKFAVTDFQERKYNDCLEKYTESLCYASFNGRQYAMALANRSATYFAMENYKSCLIDIELSLQADYPINLKPKLLIRKAKCFVNMGNLKNMIETIEDCYNQMQGYSNLPKIDRDKYMREMKSLMDIRQVCIDELPLEEATLVSEVIIEKNRLNPNVSASIKMNYNRNLGTDFVAARDIPCGEVLFVDKAYSILSYMLEGEVSKIGMFVCDYCLNEAKNCIPCKTCIKVMYCSENCLKNSWEEHHQWECDILRSNILSKDLRLALRTLIKAAFSGAIFQITNNTKPCKISNNVDQYLQIYTLYLDLASFRSKRTEMLLESCENVTLMVEFLKTTDFFTRLMSSSSCQKDFDTLVNFVGGLLIKHNILQYQRSLMRYCASSIASINKIQGKFEVILAPKNMKCLAFCPVVSGVKISCESNTSMYFNGRTCIVKACKTIKAGDRIFRSGFNFTPIVPYIQRRLVYNLLDINCKCTACKDEDIENSGDILNAYLCVACQEFAVLAEARYAICINCNHVTCVQTIKFMVQLARLHTFVRESDDLGEDLMHVSMLKRIVNPNHELLYKAYKDRLLVHSKRENITVFNETLYDFKNCASNRNGRFDKLEYVVDLIVICQAYLSYLQLNISALSKQEAMEILTSFSYVVSEAKDIAEFTFPPFLRIFIPIEYCILKFRVAHVTLQD